MKPLGKVERTARGFQFIAFGDCYGSPASLQASSLAHYAKPGTSAVWLGLEHEDFHPVTKEPNGARMHLDRKQVESLIAHLQSWLDHDTFIISKPKKGKKK